MDSMEDSFAGLFDEVFSTDQTPMIQIFAADDEEKALGTLKEFCLKHHHQYDLTTEQSPRRAIERITHEQPDVVITDWDFKNEINGIDLIKALKANPATANIPILMHTGYNTSVDDLQMALDAGATDFLTKPANFTELLARLNRIVREKEYAEKLAEQKNKLELQNSLLLTIDHDAKNYLHSMYLVMNDAKNFASKLAREELQANYNLVMSLLSNALEVQNIDDSLNLNVEKIDLHEVVNTCFKNIAGEFKRRMVTFRNEIVNVTIHADKFYLERILHNLMHNAVKYAKAAGEGEVKVTATLLNNQQVRIAVIDNGQGISPENQQKVFEFGVKDNGTTGKENKATGFGLLLAKKFVEAHQGQIAIESNGQENCMFWLTLDGTTESRNQQPVVIQNIFEISPVSAAKLVTLEAFQKLKNTHEITPVYNLLKTLDHQEVDIQEWKILLKRAIMRKDNHLLYFRLLQMVDDQAKKR